MMDILFADVYVTNQEEIDNAVARPLGIPMGLSEVNGSLSCSFNPTLAGLPKVTPVQEESFIFSSWSFEGL